jgi:hypothetical protein
MAVFRELVIKGKIMENMQMPNRPNQSTALFFGSHLPEDGHCRLKCIAGVTYL